jgi:acyl-CoA synthetase (AMP-forming)/AMP-acid ligase II
LGRLDSIVKECLPKVSLTSTSILETLVPQFEAHPLLKDLNWFVSDAVTSGGERWKEPSIDSRTLAFLQYTSGSTSQPKGVMLTHGNLLANLAAIADAFDTKTGGPAMSWLPPYHDMGLIGGILEPLFGNLLRDDVPLHLFDAPLPLASGYHEVQDHFLGCSQFCIRSLREKN